MSFYGGRPHHMEMIPTGDEGFNSGRPRYRVVCHSCGEVLHENTTGPIFRMRRHLETKAPTGETDHGRGSV